MTGQTVSWERILSDRVHSCAEEPYSVESGAFDLPGLVEAYRYCTNLTAEHSRTFYLASSLLPTSKREAVRVLYAFCRRTDDIVDRPDGSAWSNLLGWRALILAQAPASNDPVIAAWRHVRGRYRIPQCYAEQLLDGVACDLQQTRYATFGELAEYAYSVASTVGLMVSHIIGFTDRQAIPYAVKLGVALQMTNILRDVGEDWRAGRLYLPLDELAAFGLSEGDVAAGRVTENWRAFMAFQIARNRALYSEAMPGIAMLNPDGRFAISAAAVLYRGILDDIERHGADVFSRRAHVGLAGKLRRLPAAWRWSRRRLAS